jgi:hypothetical protein
MIIQNIATKQNYDVTAETWSKIVADGKAVRYKIVQAADEVKTPEGVAASDFEAIVRTGKSFFDAGKLVEAKTEFEKAKAIRETPAVIRKLAEIEKEINTASEEN